MTWCTHMMQCTHDTVHTCYMVCTHDVVHIHDMEHTHEVLCTAHMHDQVHIHDVVRTHDMVHVHGAAHMHDAVHTHESYYYISTRARLGEVCSLSERPKGLRHSQVSSGADTHSASNLTTTYFLLTNARRYHPASKILLKNGTWKKN